MKTVILAGGFGTRLSEETEVRPKPLVEVGGWPILWHIMNIYAAHGHKEFVVALGYKGDAIKSYFANYGRMRSSLSIDLASGQVDIHGGVKEDWRLHLIDTGLHTDTGGRLKRLRDWIGDEPFLMTYGDGVADVDVTALVAFHRRQGRIATVTAVHPPSRFGGITLDGDLVTEFAEKPLAGEGRINGGFFVLEPQVFDYIDGDRTNFESDCLVRLARDGQLAAYGHDGFWQCMDTLRDVRLLNKLWDTHSAPWVTR